VSLKPPKSKVEDGQLVLVNGAGLAEELMRHASHMQQEFSLPERRNICEAYGQLNNGFATELYWEGVFHSAKTALSSVVGGLALVAGHGWTHCKKIHFVTRHRFCRTCQYKIRIKRNLAEFAQFLGFATLVLGAVAFVSAVIYFLSVLPNQPSLRVILLSISSFAGGLMAMFVGWYCANCSRRWPVPKALWRIARTPFVLTGVNTVKIG
jgi:hypothetical protein